MLVTDTAPDEVVRRLYRAVELRDLGRVGSLLADDLEWVGGGTHSGQRLGREALLDQLADRVRTSGGTYALRLQRIYTDSANRAVAFLEEVTAVPGPVRTHCLLFEVTGGRVGRVQGLAPAPSGGTF